MVVHRVLKVYTIVCFSFSSSGPGACACSAATMSSVFTVTEHRYLSVRNRQRTDRRQKAESTYPQDRDDAPIREAQNLRRDDGAPAHTAS